ncbi:DUF6155 family protein [Mangrovibacterium sp.]|uniref:DUF6155 family protein n=1 Tax=Mangrovibacterium sp. TaxID=1961364 RepID=UPI003568E9A5
MATTGLKKQLNALSKEQLVKHIFELDKKYKAVQEYHQVFVNNDVSGTVAKAKKIIENEFYPARGLPKTRLSVARKAVTDAKKLGPPAEAQADLMLYYVETGVSFTRDYSDIDEPFYNSMEKMFVMALEYMYKERLLDQLQGRASAILSNSAHTGWGFHDTLCQFYSEYYVEKTCPGIPDPVYFNIN